MIPRAKANVGQILSIPPGSTSSFTISTCLHILRKDIKVGSLEKEMQGLIQVKRLSDSAICPRKGTIGSAGYDLYASAECCVPAKGKAIVKTDIAIAIPYGYYGRIAPRSSMALKHTDIGAGVIDSDYRGEIGIVLFNHSDSDLTINVHDRVAQLLIEKLSMGVLVEVDELDTTLRGVDGYGSTGV
jgi:dUTP pyrophosphatase